MTIAVVGLGLIGGSFALAAKAGGRRVVGVDCCAQTCTLAARQLDEVGGDIALINKAEAVFAAVPIDEYGAVFAAAKNHLRDDAVLFDGASSKRGVIAQAKKHLGEKYARYVPSHPVAGDEKSGFAAARADLFRGHLALLCPADADKDAAEKARGLWQLVGARVDDIDCEEHDDVFAIVSHLPHLLSYALAGLVDRYDGDGDGKDKNKTALKYAAGGFRDFTRIAGSNSALWSEIFLSNADRLLTAIGDYQKLLDETAALVRAGDADALRQHLEVARRLRLRYLEMNGREK